MATENEKILIIGAGGQIGVELTAKLSEMYGSSNVVASDLKSSTAFANNPFETLDALDGKALFDIVRKHGITQIYHLAAMLSATGEQHPMFAWKLNMESLFNVLELAKEKHISKIYWPSSIAVFGPTTPMQNTPQYTVMEPSTIYGISKQAGERWCEWYFKKFNVDVRSMRYPGLIGWKSAPGAQHYCAVRRGVLTVGKDGIAVATREAVTGDDLATLDQTVLARFRADIETERRERTQSVRQQLEAIRRMVSHLQPAAGKSGLWS